MSWILWVVVAIFAGNVLFIGSLTLIDLIRERRCKREQH